MKPVRENGASALSKINETADPAIGAQFTTNEATVGINRQNNLTV